MNISNFFIFSWKHIGNFNGRFRRFHFWHYPESFSKKPV